MISIRVLPVSRGIQVRVRAVSAGRKVRVPSYACQLRKMLTGAIQAKGIAFNHAQLRRLTSIPFWLFVERPMWTAPGYPRGWGDLRCRDLLFWFVVLSYVPGMLLIIVLVNDFPLSVPEHLGTYFTVAWLAGFAGASFYRQSFRCPRCGQLFFRRMRLIEPSARKCVNRNLTQRA